MAWLFSPQESWAERVGHSRALVGPVPYLEDAVRAGWSVEAVKGEQAGPGGMCRWPRGGVASPGGASVAQCSECAGRSLACPALGLAVPSIQQACLFQMHLSIDVK